MANDQIIAPLPGTFYRRPAPDKPPYKDEGDSVAKGDTVGLIEVMKTFHEVKSDHDGKLVKFLIDNEEAVQAGQAIADIER